MTYAYDLAGNRLRKTDTASGAVDYTLGLGDRLASFTGGAYEYDVAGCVTNISGGASSPSEPLSRALAWNSQYQLVSVATNGVLAESYTWDPLGRRASTTTSEGTIRHVYDGDECIADLDESGAVVRSYVWGPGIDNLLAVRTGGATYYALTDHQNTVHGFVDATGALVAHFVYDAWGNVLESSVSVPALAGNRYLFQGREYSWSTGLYNFRARWYDPATGRWLSKDPIGISGGMNLYMFCGNNPICCIDAFGLCKGMAEDAHDWWGGIAQEGFDKGGIIGTAQALGASTMQGFIDFFNARSIERHAGNAGRLSAIDGQCAAAIREGAIATGEILLSASIAFGGNNAAHPYYRYVGPTSKPVNNASWLARGNLWRAPYGRDFATAANKLQLPNHSVTDVVRVKNVWWKYIAGPRRVTRNPQWGTGGGIEYRIGGFRGQ